MAKRTKTDPLAPAVIVNGVYYSSVAEALGELANVKWHWIVAEGEVEVHEGCKGPDNCECWKETG